MAVAAVLAAAAARDILFTEKAEAYSKLALLLFLLLAMTKSHQGGTKRKLMR